MIEPPQENTDRELYREPPGDFYCHRISVTRSGAICIEVGGHVICMPIKKWHQAGELRTALEKLLK